MFNSLLVEMGYFSTITVGFLIIGHTHASIDQYFSCLRGIIRITFGLATFVFLGSYSYIAKEDEVQTTVRSDSVVLCT